MIPDYLQKDILSFDTETAVLGDKVVEIGFSLFRNMKSIYEWSTFINPGISIDPEASKVHKIYNSDVSSSPTFKDLAWCIYNTINAADIIVAYNAPYDLAVLEKEFTRLDMVLPKKPIIDPFIWYKFWHKFAKGKTLVKAAEMYGIPLVGAHRACNDATATVEILFKMAATKTNFPKSIDKLMKKQRELAESQFIDLQAYFIKVGKGKIDPPEYKYYE